MKNNKFERKLYPFKNHFINIQLFGEGDGDDGDANPNPNPTPDKKDDKNDNPPQVKTVSKDLYDKIASELAELKKKNKDLENKGKTEQQIKDDEIAEKEQALKQKEKELAEKQLELNKANIVSELSEIKAVISLDEKIAKIDDFAPFLLNDDEKVTTENAKKFAKLLKAVYEKGAEDKSNDKFFNVAKDTDAKDKDDDQSDYSKYRKNDFDDNAKVEL